MDIKNASSHFHPSLIFQCQDEPTQGQPCRTAHGLHAQHLMFFVTYKWAKKATVFVPGRPFQPNVMQHSSLLGPFASHEGNKVL
jgi:hypothetical protein